MKAATLAVGTEVVDGQITDRNSAWISSQLVASGIEVIEHRAVADDHAAISKALIELSDQVDLLFVTGGLGPTSDDFTRELIASVFEAPLSFDQASWEHIERRFQSRGLAAKPIQRQQCFFPRGAKILENPAGTANAFWLADEKRAVNVFALPGPPLEIAAVWKAHLASHIESLIPELEREELFLWRTLGEGESAIAEKIEPIIAGHGLRVGYRAHLPYVEVKLWAKKSDLNGARSSELRNILDEIENALSAYVVIHGKSDFADTIVDLVRAGQSIRICDSATGGELHSRLFERIKEARSKGAFEGRNIGRLVVESGLTGPSEAALARDGDGFDLEVRVSENNARKIWQVRMGSQEELDVSPTALYSFGTDRGRRYLAEKVFQLLREKNVDTTFSPQRNF